MGGVSAGMELPEHRLVAPAPPAADGPSLCLPALPGAGIYGRAPGRGAAGEGFVCSGAPLWGHVLVFVLGALLQG